MKRLQESRSGIAVTTLLSLVTLLLTASAVAAQDTEADLDIRVPKNKYCLVVESLIDDVADVDVRRFTVFSRSQRAVTFRFGQAGAIDQPMERVPGTRNLFFYESILISRLERLTERDENGIPRSKPVLTQFSKFTKRAGSSIETPFDARGVRTLSQVIDIPSGDKCFRFGHNRLIGTVQDRKIRVRVK